MTGTTDTYADGFLDGWATAAETLRTRFYLTARDAATGQRIDAAGLGGVGGHSDLPGGKPGDWAPILGHPKLMREALCVAQHAPGLSDRQSVRLERLIDACDLLRPIGPDGKHCNRHTPWCGCDDVPSDPEGRPWFVGPHPSLVREQVANTHTIDLREALDCQSCTVRLMMAGACMHCGWAMP